jgi:hypothetical protein
VTAVKAASPPPPAQTSASADPGGAPREPLAWSSFDAGTFARARAEHKFVVLDGAAEWCHWCHVMEASTYHDPAVQKLLAARFIAAKVDVDARPDIEERYGDYGWPATVIFSPDGQELGKYRGYLAPDAFLEILRSVVAAKTDARAANAEAPPLDRVAGKGPLPEEELEWIARLTTLELADYYDEENGGWGKSQKAAMAMDNAWELDRARRGDPAAKARVLFTLAKQRALFDPVWGGIYQYSAAGDWDRPHFEKLMTFQAGALDNYAEAYALTRDAQWLEAARSVRAYVDRFLTSPEGGFYATQDADLNAHDAGKPYLNGHEYYALDDAHRRALGVPRIDTHEYGKENGLAIAAYVSFSQATGDASALATAERAAKRILATHPSPRGGITHDPETGTAVLHLADNAAFGLALMRLHDATSRPDYLEGAKRIADFLLRDLADDRGGGFFAGTLDPGAVGVFATRRKPFEDNVTAIRFLARLAKLQPEDPRYRTAIAGTLRAIATPDAIKARGRMLGDFLLALEETRGLR